jgi:transcriptional regulator with XRE-family HTH domain
MDPDMHLGQRVAHLRRRRGISQLTLAGRMGRSESWISKVERGERRIDRVSVIEQLATVLDVDPGTLLGWGEGSRGDEPCEAERSGNRLALAGCSRMVVHAFLDAGHCRRALELASAAAGALQPELDGSPALESVYGALLLKGAVAAARGGDRAITRELLPRRRAPRSVSAATTTTAGPPSAPPTSCCTRSRPPWSWATAARP